MTVHALQLRTILETPNDAPAPGLWPRLGPDDYPAAEARTGETRQGLESLLPLDSRPVNVTTRSPRILRDLDLLRRLDGHHAVSVGIALPSLDPACVRRLEGSTAPPAERLRAMAEVAAAGVYVKLLWSPALPGLNDDPRAVDRLFAAARHAGAHDVELDVPEVSMWERAKLPESLRGLFDLRGRLREAETRSLWDLFDRKRMAHGFPRAVPGRG